MSPTGEIRRPNPCSILQSTPYPASPISVLPVIKIDMSLAQKRTTRATSSGTTSSRAGAPSIPVTLRNVAGGAARGRPQERRRLHHGSRNTPNRGIDERARAALGRRVQRGGLAVAALVRGSLRGPPGTRPRARGLATRTRRGLPSRRSRLGAEGKVSPHPLPYAIANFLPGDPAIRVRVRFREAAF